VRPVTSAIGAGALALALAGCWPAPGQGPDRTNHNPLETRINPANVDTLVPKWTVGPTEVPGLPIVVGNVVYGTTFQPNDDGNPQLGGLESLTGYDLRTGEQVSSVPVLDLPYRVVTSDPWIVGHGDRIAVGWGSVTDLEPPLEADARSFDLATGAPAGSVGRGPIESVRGDVVVSSSTERVDPQLDVRTIEVRHLDDPELSWDAPFQYLDLVEAPPAGIGHGDLTLGVDRLFQAGPGPTNTTPGAGGYNDLAVRAYPASGVQTGCGPAGRDLACPSWVTPIDLPQGGELRAPMIAPDQATVYVAAVGNQGVDYNGFLYALDAATGAVEWRAELPTAAAGVPALADGVVYLPARDGHLLAFDADGCGAAACEPLWSAQVTDHGANDGPPIVAGGVVFIGSEDGVFAYDADGCGASTCDPLWSAPSPRGATALAESNGRLLVLDEAGMTAYGLP
jgi:hypothetical protein